MGQAPTNGAPGRGLFRPFEGDSTQGDAGFGSLGQADPNTLGAVDPNAVLPADPLSQSPSTQDDGFNQLLDFLNQRFSGNSKGGFGRGSGGGFGNLFGNSARNSFK